MASICFYYYYINVTMLTLGGLLEKEAFLTFLIPRKKFDKIIDLNRLLSIRWCFLTISIFPIPTNNRGAYLLFHDTNNSYTNLSQQFNDDNLPPM